jgi:hypothetical protein
MFHSSSFLLFYFTLFLILCNFMGFAYSNVDDAGTRGIQKHALTSALTEVAPLSRVLVES